jgi:hypothetical protein
LTAKIEAARATVQGHADAAATLTKDLAKLKAEADKSKPVSIPNSFRWTISFASAPAQTQPARTQPARPH